MHHLLIIHLRNMHSIPCSGNCTLTVLDCNLPVRKQNDPNAMFAIVRWSFGNNAKDLILVNGLFIHLYTVVAKIIRTDSLFCSPMLYLFYSKYIKNSNFVKYFYNLKTRWQE